MRMLIFRDSRRGEPKNLPHSRIQFADPQVVINERSLINAAMPWFSLVHHHLLIYDHAHWPCMEVMTYIVRFNSEDQGPHGT